MHVGNQDGSTAACAHKLQQLQAAHRAAVEIAVEAVGAGLRVKAQQHQADGGAALAAHQPDLPDLNKQSSTHREGSVSSPPSSLLVYGQQQALGAWAQQSASARRQMDEAL